MNTKYRWIRLMLERHPRCLHHNKDDYNLGLITGVVCAKFVDLVLPGKPSHITLTLSNTPLKGGGTTRYDYKEQAIEINGNSYIYSTLKKNIEALDLPESGKFYYRFDKLSAKDYQTAV